MPLPMQPDCVGRKIAVPQYSTGKKAEFVLSVKRQGCLADKVGKVDAAGGQMNIQSPRPQAHARATAARSKSRAGHCKYKDMPAEKKPGLNLKQVARSSGARKMPFTGRQIISAMRRDFVGPGHCAVGANAKALEKRRRIQEPVKTAAQSDVDQGVVKGRATASLLGADRCAEYPKENQGTS